MPSANYRSLHSVPVVRTYAEGFIDGHEDGYEIGCRDAGLELLALGFVAGALIAAGLCSLLIK